MRGWYLDDDGERLPADRLFALSPWSCPGPVGPVKLLCRFLDLRDGSVRFNTPCFILQRRRDHDKEGRLPSPQLSTRQPVFDEPACSRQRNKVAAGFFLLGPSAVGKLAEIGEVHGVSAT